MAEVADYRGQMIDWVGKSDRKYFESVCHTPSENDTWRSEMDVTKALRGAVLT